LIVHVLVELLIAVTKVNDNTFPRVKRHLPLFRPFKETSHSLQQHGRASALLSWQLRRSRHYCMKQGSACCIHWAEWPDSFWWPCFY